ncbi:hypothetical protein GPALN_005291 [Globodera pallida]|nr:hypothetical protein GPALN_005291 [Globodera pallida]
MPFIVSRRRRIKLLNLSSFPAAFLIAHLHILALARVTERDAFGTSPPLPSQSPTSADSLGAPIAFPIFRPPIVPVRRQKTIVEQEKPSVVLRHFPAPSFPNQSTAEEISVTSDGTSSALSSSVVEEDDNSSHQPEEEELAFSPVHIFNTKMNNVSNNSAHPPVALHHLELFGTHRKENDGGIDQTTTTPNLLLSTNLPTKGKSPPNSAFPSTTTSSTTISSSSSSTLRLLPNSNGARASITPQFPVFTGMRMQIIESNESEGERSSTSAGEDNEDHLHSHQQKMHYNRTNKSKPNDQNLLDVVRPNKLIGENASSNSSAIVKTSNRENGMATGGRSNAFGTFAPTIRIEPVTKPTIGSSLGQLKIGAVKNSTALSIFPSTTDEVTEDLLLALISSTNGPLIHPPRKPSFKAPVGEHGDSFGQQIGESTVQMITKLPTMGPSEEVIPRPTTPKTREGDRHWVEQSSPNTTKPATTQPTTSSSSTMKSTTATASEPTQLPTTTTTFATTTTTATPTNTVTRTTATKTTEHSEGGDIRGQLTDDRITIGTRRTTQTTTTSPSQSIDLSQNHIEEEVGETITTTPMGRPTTSIWSSILQKFGGEHDLQGENTLEASRSTEHSSYGSASLRLFVIAGIIAVLFIAVGIGSICTGRYVRKSRQLHGKYRPAAYELQTTRPPPLTGGSSAAIPPPPNTMFSTNEHHQQQQNHQQRFEFGHLHQIPTHYSQQLTLNGNGGREERLI